MKSVLWILLPVSLSTPTAAQEGAPALAAGLAESPPASYTITERGPHHRLWSRVSWETNRHGQVVAVTNSAYTELSTGLHFWDATAAQWKESEARFEITPLGYAVAQRGQHQVILAPNINATNAVDLQMPEGQRLRSRPRGLVLHDTASGTNVLIAELKDCAGQLLSPDVVIYPDAFSGLRVALRYTYTRDAFEQDVVVYENFGSPAAYGLDPATTQLETWTEFFTPPTPRLTAVQTRDGSEDQRIEFCAMALGQGQAYFLDLTNRVEPSLAVRKSWQQIAGRTFLVEAVRYATCKPLLDRLVATRQGQDSLFAQKVVSGRDALAAQFRPGRQTESKLLASITPGQMSGQPGLVLDYTTLDTTQSGYVFKGDTTYYISGTVNLNGTTTFEGGTVIKYGPANSAILILNGPSVWQGGMYRPSVFTARDDNTVGETITGSTGNPTTNYYATAMLRLNTDGAALKHLRMSYATKAIQLCNWSENYSLSHAQLVNCQVGFHNYIDDGVALTLHNVLFSKVARFGDGNWSHYYGEHVTVDQSTNLYGDDIVLNNSLIVASSGISGGTSNAFLSSGTGVFQSVGAGSYYLYDNTYRNAGTTNISADLANDLRSRTTFPPLEISSQTINSDTCWTPHVQRDNDLPDLGYHYDPLDYVVNAVTVSAELTLASGVAVGTYGASSSRGLYLFNGSLVSEGAPTRLNWIVRYNTVQEQSTADWSASTVGSGVEGASSAGAVQVRFTGWSLLGGVGRHFNYYSDGAAVPAFSHCQFGGGHVLLGPGSVALTNCLWQRVRVFLSDDESNPEWYLYNNLFYGGKLECTLANAVMQAYDNLFDQTTISQSGTITHDYNGYVTNQSRLSPNGAHDVILTNNPVYQAGYVGRYYYPTNDGNLSRLFEVGSRSASAAGLCRHTTVTNQTQEGESQVDIGFHCVPVQPAAEVPKSSITASASSSNGGRQPGKAIDNSAFDPGWHDDYVGTPGWLRLDLGAATQVRRLDYQPPQAASDGTVQDYEIYVTDSNSSDVGDWGLPVAVGTWHWPNGDETKSVEFNKSGRYVILRCVSGAWGYAAANEVWVYRANTDGLLLVGADTEPDNVPDYLDCCEPLNFTNALGLRVAVEDSAGVDGDGMCCSGTNGCNPNVQVVTNTASIGGCPGWTYDLAVTITGVVEAQNAPYDYVYVNDVEVFHGESEGWGCVMTNKIATKLITVAGPATITLKYDTVDEKYHTGAYAVITNISLLSRQYTNAPPCN